MCGAQHSTGLNSSLRLTAHVQEELTLLAPCGKSPLPQPALALTLSYSLPPAHPDVIKEFSSCLFALDCSCSPCFTHSSLSLSLPPSIAYACVPACERKRVCVCARARARACLPVYQSLYPCRPPWQFPWCASMSFWDDL